MEYRCEDLPQFGVVLVPPSSAEFGALLGDIEARLANPKPGWPPKFPQTEDPSGPAMILCNRSQTGIAALNWIWKFEVENGRTTGSSVSTAGGGTSLLAPFGLDERTRKLYEYWNVILPGSKRRIRGNSMFGDNTDVRAPREDELWKGGSITGIGGGSRLPVEPLKSVTLTIDGVFFVDGGVAGADTFHSYGRVAADVDAHLRVGKIARDGHDQGLSPDAIFAQIEAVTGPDRGSAAPPPPRRASNDAESSLRNLAAQIAMMRRGGMGDDRVIYTLMSWADAVVPKFRKL